MYTRKLIVPTLLILAAPAGLADSIKITPQVPTDIKGGAVDARVANAADFAWQEFIALSWPADTTGGQRDTPDTSLPFGDPSYSGPLVWHTYRHKSEIFPGHGDPAGYDTTAEDFGYNTLPPVYTYEPDVGDNGIIQACPGQAVPANGPALINLDETSQIGLDYMFAGVAPTDVDAELNTYPQLIRFLAQGNETYYAYAVNPDAIVAGGDPLFTHPQPCPSEANDAGYDHTYCVAKRNFTKVSGSNGETTAFPGPVVNFPAGTILVKGAFRELTKEEKLSGRYYTATVRYYENPPGMTGQKQQCYREREWGLVSLHIIHRTPSSPNFVFATFEQVDNLLTADGRRVEREDGRFQEDGDAATATTPELFYQDPADPNMPATLTIAGDPNDPADYCQDPGKRLYYIENPAHPPLPSKGPICQNYRDHPIPAPIREANRNAHQAIEKYARKHGFRRSPARFYRLINVQPEPFDETQIESHKKNDNRSPAIFYLANIMLETDYSLQHFSGQLADGLKTDQPPNFNNYNGRQTYQNTLTFSGSSLTNTANMGGCMGCHGVAQLGGNDFSFVLGGGRVSEPEVPGITEPGTSNPAPGSPRYDALEETQ